MPLPQNNPEQSPSWEKLKNLATSVQATTLIDLFKNDSSRVSKMSLEWQDFYVDFSKNLITEEAWNALYDLAIFSELDAAKQAYFNGDLINETEGRAVLHTALRAKHSNAKVNGKEVNHEVAEVKQRIQALSEAVISGSKKRIYSKALHRHCKHWDRRVRFGSCDGYRSTSLLQKPPQGSFYEQC